MNEAVTKRFLLYFRLMLLAWILIANAVIHLTGMEYSWLIFLSNIMMFTLEGDVKDRSGPWSWAVWWVWCSPSSLCSPSPL